MSRLVLGVQVPCLLDSVYDNSVFHLVIREAESISPKALIISAYRQISRLIMLMYGKEASNRKQETDRQHYTIPNQRPKDKHCGKI